MLSLTSVSHHRGLVSGCSLASSGEGRELLIVILIVVLLGAGSSLTLCPCSAYDVIQKKGEILTFSIYREHVMRDAYISLTVAWLRREVKFLVWF